MPFAYETQISGSLAGKPSLRSVVVALSSQPPGAPRTGHPHGQHWGSTIDPSRKLPTSRQKLFGCIATEGSPRRQQISPTD